MTFEQLDLIEPILNALKNEGYTTPTPIQEKSIPIILKGGDLLGCAQTGTGKTAAFAIPILQQLYNQKGNDRGPRKIKALIITPTRELAIQINESFNNYGRNTNLRSTVIFGGVPQNPQVNALKAGVEILIATPGRLLDLIGQGFIKLNDVGIFVLDEADRMLDMGFHDDIVRIISYLPEKRQNLLFSATMPPKIRSLSKKILDHPVEVNIAISKPSEGILQQAYLAYDEQKIDLLKNILSQSEFKSVIVFASRKETVKKLNSTLNRHGILSEAFHSDLDQESREDIMVRFRGKSLSVLIGTDVISRGIDVVGISLVVNFDVPPDPEDYIHRIGRTARAETKGTAITFINDKDQHRFGRIEALIEKEVPKLPLPEGMAAGPVYNPKAKREGTFNPKWKKNFKKRA
jgi:superfamily II DNA/RNA helicase